MRTRIRIKKLLNIFIGFLPVVNKGEKIRYAIFATGSVLSYSYDYIIGNKISTDLYSFPFIKPIDDFQLLSIFKKGYQKVITIEEHQKNGGFGSCILEKLNLFLLNGDIEKTTAPFIEVVGIEDQFISVAGTQSYLRDIANISLTSKQFTVLF
jgi:transketolase